MKAMTQQIKTLFFLLAVMLLPATVMAQEDGGDKADFRIAKFKRNMTDLTASKAAVKDNNGVEGALLRFSAKDGQFTYTPNLGVLKAVQGTGEVLIYVPKGTKLITIRHPRLGIIRDYRIPETVESKAVYDIVIEIMNVEKKHPVYVGAGFNVVGLMGPEASVGINFGGFNAEAGFIYGIKKSDDHFMQDPESGDDVAGYSYSATRAFLRLGWEIKLANAFTITPLVGGAMNFISGKELMKPSPKGKGYDKTTTISGTAGARFRFRLGEHFSLQATPEYLFAISKDDVAKTIEIKKKQQNQKVEYDDTSKSWTEGFGMALGLLIYF